MTTSGYWSERKSARGHAYRVWRSEPMPRIEQRYLDCAIYLYASEASAKAGENFGGSGCLVSIRGRTVWDETSSQNWRYPKAKFFYPDHIYAVTNNHVARGFPVIRLNTIDGETDVLDLHDGDWIPHPDGDDLAVVPIDLPRGIHSSFPIQTSMFLDKEDIGRVGAGDDTFMVGRFISHAGKQRNTPSLRFGNIAMLPFEKVKLGQAANHHEQEAFLVETRSISGFSGSPVFVYEPSVVEAEIPPPDDGYDHQSKWITSIGDLVGDLRFLGIDCGHVPKYEKVVNGAGTPHPQGWKIDTNTGMAIVIPAWRLGGLLNMPKLITQRNRKDEKYKQEREQEETASLDVERPETFTKESYQDALRRASRKVLDTLQSYGY